MRHLPASQVVLATAVATFAFVPFAPAAAQKDNGTFFTLRGDALTYSFGTTTATPGSGGGGALEIGHASSSGFGVYWTIGGGMVNKVPTGPSSQYALMRTGLGLRWLFISAGPFGVYADVEGTANMSTPSATGQRVSNPQPLIGPGLTGGGGVELKLGQAAALQFGLARASSSLSDPQNNTTSYKDNETRVTVGIRIFGGNGGSSSHRSSSSRTTPCNPSVPPIRNVAILSVINVNYSYTPKDLEGGRSWHRGDVLDELNTLGRPDGNSFAEPNGQQPNFHITYTISNDGQDHYTGSVELSGWGQGHVTTINKYQYPYASSAKLVQDLTDEMYQFIHLGWHDARQGCYTP